ncbi:MAG: amidase [Chloroflexi bacterium]|nr:amidase [Chloroflexota bacterium]
MNDVLFEPISRLSELIRTRQVSPVEVTEAALGRIEALDGRLRAFITVLADQARQEASLAEREIVAGRWRGPLHGVPIGLKDLYSTRGIRTTAASLVYRDIVPEYDSAVTERLQAAGSVLLGKTNMTEIAYGPSDWFHEEFGLARNPWGLDRFPGGSSTGSGIAVATGMTYMAMGSDTGGSIRNPASFCGVSGLKPTYGLVSCYGAYPSSWTLDHMGPLARSAEDCAISLQALAGYDPRDPNSADHPVPDYRATINDGVGGLRVGIMRTHFFQSLEPAVEQAVLGAVETLRSLGASVSEVDVPGLVEDSNAAFRFVVTAEASAFHRPHLPQDAEGYVPDIREKLLGGLEIPAVDYIAALEARRRLGDNLERVFDQVDLLVAPTRDTLPPRQADNGNILDRFPYAVEGRPSLTIPFNVGGQPAISIPCGFEAGLPIGVQFVGRRFDDAGVLRAAHAYQQATDWHLRRPEIVLERA